MSDGYLCSYQDGTIFRKKIGLGAIHFRYLESSCIHCLLDMKKTPYFDSETLYECVHCGWWVYDYRYETTDEKEQRLGIQLEAAADVKHYKISDESAPIVELRKYLMNHPKRIAQINPCKFELLMQDVMKDHFSECEVIHVGGTGDMGVDLKLVRNDLETILVQIKRREDLSSNEGVKVVRELNGVLFREGLAQGMVVTTRKGFTKGAIKEIELTSKNIER